ncbi:hypothetical protein EII14_01850 [Alloprevotella sp. OH1205_COT-284]|uniref:hypothetical protein n=1 Tax=Alloprevotella sp. OH1205_COT-284 TaxID=2491043 RepID=UPI000F5E8923|nr:hypothetical protein [Alloprevotella sp. OH1205_COT-284]RRD80557.1 hypothetical protein EII14_01850 [Alloprevotella sp. OH1205_COT-284]
MPSLCLRSYEIDIQDNSRFSGGKTAKNKNIGGKASEKGGFIEGGTKAEAEAGEGTLSFRPSTILFVQKCTLNHLIDSISEKKFLKYPQLQLFSSEKPPIILSFQKKAIPLHSEMQHISPHGKVLHG